jgi:hypothetical protein
MQLSSNFSHWVCLLAGLYLVATGLMLRGIADDQPPALTMPPASKWGRQRMAGFGRRAVLIMVGLLAVAYGISRLLL